MWRVVTDAQTRRMRILLRNLAEERQENAWDGASREEYLMCTSSEDLPLQSIEASEEGCAEGALTCERDGVKWCTGNVIEKTAYVARTWVHITHLISSARIPLVTAF